MSSCNKEEQYSQNKQKPHPTRQETFQEGWQNPPHPFQELPSFPSSLQRKGDPTLVLGILFIHRGAVHQDNQEEEKGCGEAEPAHLHGLAGGLLWMLGMNWDFNILAERLHQALRKGVRQGRSWVSPVYCEIPPPNHASCFCLQGIKCPVTAVLRLDYACASCVNTDCDQIDGVLFNMVTQGASEHLEQCITHDGWSVSR